MLLASLYAALGRRSIIIDRLFLRILLLPEGLPPFLDILRIAKSGLIKPNTQRVELLLLFSHLCL